MTAPVVFVDTETTGLDPDRHEVWEVAAIYDTPGGWAEWEAHLPVNLTTADPTGLRIGRFYERRRALRPTPDKVATVSRERWSGDEKWLVTSAAEIVETLAGILDGKHIVGAVPDFDARFLTRLLNRHGHAATWHYHLVDVEALAAGRMQIAPPWRSNDLSRLVGVAPEDFDRHTAIGDARWARAIYDAVVGGSLTSAPRAGAEADG